MQFNTIIQVQCICMYVHCNSKKDVNYIKHLTMNTLYSSSYKALHISFLYNHKFWFNTQISP